MKKTHGFVSKSVVALALLGALPAAAGTATYAGALCAAVSGTPTIFRSGRLINQTGSDMEVVCPIQRNITNVPYYTEDMTITATVLDPSITDDVCCTAAVSEADGTYLATARTCTPANSGDYDTHRTLSMNLPSVYAGPGGYLSLRCELPKQVSIDGAMRSSVLASFIVTE
ncbi:hypothetical protein [Myxococcus sp. RHSTA-1-4]|uniref:hypothetical protein n=1 Tax=Myxococcus sp. RHSTA-1-4 TaxID=2874601 RepID=UPI001CBEA219|nr:hypothetical protein [Myxococcus sp. RHSTA-1-4]MBZ4415448.1 hypothetical protein [Myxococcus sp. RHSTA-1-4]